MGQSIHKESWFKRLLNGKGFYAALAVCLLAIGVGAAAVVRKAAQKAPETEEPPISSVTPVEKNVTDVPDTRTTAPTTTTTAPKPTTTVAQEAPAADLFILPVSNAVQKYYSDGEPVYSVTMQDWRTHDGADFAADEGANVRALADGTVTAVGEDPLWGETLTIDHGVGVSSTYIGVHATVAAGAKVKVGQNIGTIVTIPCEAAQAPHLHLEMTVDGERVDPVEALGRETHPAE